MNNSILDFATKFLLNTKEVEVTDFTDYAAQSIVPAKVSGIITAKRVQTPFYLNSDYSTPDILPGTSDSKTFYGPSFSGYGLPESGYSVIYSIKVLDEVINSTACTMTSTTLLKFASANITTALNALLTNANSVKLMVYDSGNGLLGEVAVSAWAYDGVANMEATVAALATWEDAHHFRIATYYSSLKSYIFCNTLPKPKLMVTVDCLRAQITVQDKTNWLAGYGISNHDITVQYPRDASGTPVASPVSTDQYSLVVGPDIYSGGYTVSVSSDVSYTQNDELIVVGTISGFKNFDVQCDVDLCCLADCVTKLHEAYLAGQRTGATNNAILFQQLFNFQIFYTRYRMAIDCMDVAVAGAILQQMKDFLKTSGVDCDCDCGCGEADSAPRVIKPLYSE